MTDIMIFYDYDIFIKVFEEAKENSAYQLRAKVCPWSLVTALGFLSEYLFRTSVGHSCLDDVQCWVVFTKVVRHVAIRVDCQQICTTVGGKQIHEQQKTFLFHIC